MSCARGWEGKGSSVHSEGPLESKYANSNWAEILPESCLEEAGVKVTRWPAAPFLALPGCQGFSQSPGLIVFPHSLFLCRVPFF